ncbi:PcfJ domain-containing protein [Xanthomonas oryzae]|uniref:PcfJ domain-containing protein n=1 Tax=Xanthomonas oryzae TaxID=347 RepID=UPI003DA1A414
MMLRDNSTEPEFIGDASDKHGELALAPPRRRRRASSFGGREDLGRVYAAAKDLIIKHKLLVLKQFEEVDGVKRLTICNLWRIERHPDQSTTAFEFDLETGEWARTEVFGEWPAIPIWPVSVTKKSDYWPTVIRTAIWKALIAVGFNDLPEFHNPWPKKVLELHQKRIKAKGYWRCKYTNDWYHESDRQRLISDKEATELGLTVPKGHKAEMTPRMMAYSLLAAYTTPAKKKKDKGWLRKDSMEKGARALRAALWEHFLDRDVVSAQLALHRDTLSFASCLDWAVNRREHLLRVTSESRNLLPLLVSIDFKHWHRSDLFSRKLWVRGARKTTPVDRGFYNASESRQHLSGHGRSSRYGFHSFEIKAAWRWLSKASMMIVKSWVEYGRDNAVATNLALATSNIQRKIPVVAVVRLIEASPDNRHARDLPRYGVSPVLQQVYRLYLIHAAQLWADEGFKAVRAWAGYPGSNRFSDVGDYLEAEGFAQGLPDKNSTWASLERRSADWHRRIAIQNMEKQLSGIPEHNWAVAVPEIEIDGIACRPLLSSREMAVEGYEMSHCVGGYTPRCIDGRYRVYSLLEPDGTRSTLGLRITRRQVSVEQHRGNYNGPISPLAEAAGRELAVRYRQALGPGKKHHSPRHAPRDDTP